MTAADIRAAVERSEQGDMGALVDLCDAMRVDPPRLEAALRATHRRTEALYFDPWSFGARSVRRSQ